MKGCNPSSRWRNLPKIYPCHPVAEVNFPADDRIVSWIADPIWVFPKIGVPQNAWFIMENPIKMDDLWIP